MTKETTRNAYAILCGMWVIAIACYIALFLLSVALGEEANLIATFGCCCLFPVFALVYGILSYQLSRRIFVPNLLYVLFSVLTGLLLNFTMIYSSALLDPHWDAAFPISPFWKEAINVFPLYFMITIFFIAASIFIAVASSVLTMIAAEMRKKLRKGETR